MHHCTCGDTKCLHHPSNHNQGCTPCIAKNLRKGEIPACFFRKVNQDVSSVTDWTMEGFSRFIASQKK